MVTDADCRMTDGGCTGPQLNILRGQPTPMVGQPKAVGGEPTAIRRLKGADPLPPPHRRRLPAADLEAIERSARCVLSIGHLLTGGVGVRGGDGGGDHGFAQNFPSVCFDDKRWPKRKCIEDTGVVLATLLRSLRSRSVPDTQNQKVGF